MSWFLHGLNVWSEAWANLAWAVFWQSTLLIGLIALLALLLRRSSPTVRYWLWQIVAIKLLVMPFWTLAVPMPFLAMSSRPSSLPPTGPAYADSPTPDGATWPEWPGAGSTSVGDGAPRSESVLLWLQGITWRSWLFLGWAAVVVFAVARLFRQHRQLGRLLGGATPAGKELSDLLGELANELGLKRVPAALLVDDDCSLFLCGLRRPVVVAPSGLAASLRPCQLRQALLHELAHVKRLDLLWGWPMEIARIVYFFHPLVHWAGRQLRLERELACDQLAMSLTGGDAADYANTLVQVVNHASQPPTIRSQAAISAQLDGGRRESRKTPC